MTRYENTLTLIDVDDTGGHDLTDAVTVARGVALGDGPVIPGASIVRLDAGPDRAMTATIRMRGVDLTIEPRRVLIQGQHVVIPPLTDASVVRADTGAPYSEDGLHLRRHHGRDVEVTIYVREVRVRGWADNERPHRAQSLVSR